ncbi:MAG: rare lipoprotein [Clostridiales bacterium]|jgi:rare lipoprotein A|nr:rare lipoprotein [Clostridiales bacterium]MDN5280842.1 rare lipoprotein [Candidatus Ozemobacter sp.]
MKDKLIKCLILFLLPLFLTGCTDADSSSDNSVVFPTAGIYQTGIASWYGAEYQGLPTASGEAFDRNSMTAAHKELPFQTWVEVTNLENGRQVTVRINDRGPFVAGRIIDLSEKAADELGMKNAGLAQVSLKIVGAP